MIFKCYDSRCDAAIRTSSSVSMSVGAVTPDSELLSVDEVFSVWGFAELHYIHK